MTVADVIIVHFAFGSPFGVYQITRSVRSARSAASVAAYFVLWPVFAIAFVRDWMSRLGSAEKLYLDQRTTPIRKKMETLAFSDDSTTSVFEFREVFARYTGLTVALKSVSGIDASQSLSKISGHPDRHLITACITRKNKTRLSFHQSRAKTEFNELMLHLAAFNPNGDRLSSLALELDSVLESFKNEAY